VEVIELGKLDGKVAIISGGARGQGAAHVREFVKEGAKVVFSDILEEEGKALEKELGDNAKFVKHDVTKLDEWKNVINETESTFGPVNILVNNAGILKEGNIEDISEEDYRQVIDINQVGVFLGMKAVISSMKKTENGSIINLSSVDGLLAVQGRSAYDSSKFATRGITKTAALEFAKYGVRVNSVHPGYIETPMIDTEDPEELEKLEKFRQQIPMKRSAQPEEVTKYIIFLASDDSGYSTGSEFVIDGGITASLL